MQITPVNETLWYRRFWLIVGVVFLLGFMAANYLTTRWAIVSAYRAIRIMEADR